MAPKKKQNWIRTGGAIGDESMSKLDEFQADGCGVSEKIESVDCQPNEKFERGPDRKHID